MKTIQTRDIQNVNADKVEPGMIVAEGIVIDVRKVGDEYLLDFAHGQTAYVPADGHAQVYARVSNGVFDVLKEAAKEAEYSSTRNRA